MKSEIALTAILIAALFFAGCLQPQAPKPETTAGLQGPDYFSIPNPAKTVGYSAVYNDKTYNITSEITIFAKGNKKRSDIKYLEAEGDISPPTDETSIIDYVKTEEIDCDAIFGELRCQKFVFKTVEPDPGHFDRPAPGDLAVEYTGTMQVAGTTANCYKLTDTDTGGIFYYTIVNECYSPEGVPLFTQLLIPYGTGTEVLSERKAVSYVVGISDSDFEPPVEPVEMPTNEIEWPLASD